MQMKFLGLFSTANTGNIVVPEYQTTYNAGLG